MANQYNKLYWIEDKDDPSVEFEHTLTYSSTKAKKFLKDLQQIDKTRRFVIRSQKRGIDPRYAKTIFGNDNWFEKRHG
jgi:hypothetical protein